MSDLVISQQDIIPLSSAGLTLVTLVFPTHQYVRGEYIIIGIIVVVAEGVTRLREVPWHRRGKENRTNKKPVIQAVY